MYFAYKDRHRLKAKGGKIYNADEHYKKGV